MAFSARRVSPEVLFDFARQRPLDRYSADGPSGPLVLSDGVLYGTTQHSANPQDLTPAGGVLYGLEVPPYAGPPSISINDAVTVERADAIATFAVRLSWAPERPVTVDFATADGTATAGSDYFATAGTLTFYPGVTSRAVRVPVMANKAPEGAETFTVQLSNPINSMLARAQGTGTIRPLRTPIRGAGGRRR